VKKQWEEWLLRGQKDLRVAKMMFEEKDYEHAAYMTQQALEKHVKAAWVMANMAQPKKLKHDIVGYILNKSIENFEEWEFVPSGLSKHELKENLEMSKYIINEMKKDGEVRSMFWKVSLGIEVNKLPACLDEYESKIKKVVGDGKAGNKTNKVLRLVVKNAKKEASRYAKKRISGQKKMRANVGIATALVAGLLVATFPHNAYGRYPYVICNGKEKKSAEIYVKRCKNLKNLIDCVEEACKKIAGMTKNVGRATRR